LRLSHIIEQVYFKPWLITSTGWASIDKLIQSKLATSPELIAAEIKALKQAQDDPVLYGEDGDEYEALPYERSNGIATIHINGVIGRRLSWVEKACTDCTDTIDVTDSLRLAYSDAKVGEIRLHIDSPGGTVTGIPELAEYIAHLSRGPKRIHAFTEGMCCSAAYWLAAGCSTVSASRSADIGSIGVYQAWFDQSRQFANEGIAAEIVKAGKWKAEGYPGTSISDDYRKMLQSEVDAIYGWFTSFVKKYRPRVSDETRQGQSFMGEEALSRGLITHLSA
jgi:signal peptide peptidase SppA